MRGKLSRFNPRESLKLGVVSYYNDQGDAKAQEEYMNLVMTFIAVIAAWAAVAIAMIRGLLRIIRRQYAPSPSITPVISPRGSGSGAASFSH